MRSPSRGLLKSLARGLATLLVAPVVVSFRVRARLIGKNRALEGSTQLLAVVPGVTGQYFRRAFLQHALASVHPSVAIEFGTIFSQVGATIEENVYIGPRCHLGLVHLECDVLIGAGVHIPSGPHTHDTRNTLKPIKDQPHQRELVRVGQGSWIGNSAVVMAHVGRDTIVGAGAVVTKPLPPRVVAGGVPARVLKSRTTCGKYP